jgi:hypothetical protein
MTYIVQPGDTLYSIAARFGIPLQTLMTANPGLQAGMVFVGQIITVPNIGGPVPRPPIPPVPPGGGLEQRINRLERELRELERINREQDRLIRQFDNRLDRLERRVQRLEER